MKLVVGLGNPGKKYQDTRHNVGFEVLSELVRRFPGDRPKGRFSGETMDLAVTGQKILLLWPHTFMNVSGKSVLAARDFYKIEDEDLLVVCDDFQLPLGKLRLRASGSSSGQKGLDDCLRRLGTQRLSRLRLGIGPVPERWDVADFVLGKFDESDQPQVQQMVRRSADAVETWVSGGIQEAMNRFNGDA
jgi:PTH1 family peptidyl-tRNA hydrolase